MRKYITLLSIILIVSSCDVEEEPFINDYDSYVNPDKKVLIEDFTGHKCPNCPDAARELEAIHAIYGDQIIGMAIHVSSFARPYHISQAPQYQYDFRTKWGDDWDAFYDQYGRLMWRCREVQTGRFTQTAKCIGLSKDDDRWPNK